MSRSTGSGATTGRIASAVILAVVAIAFLVVGIIYCVEPAGSLPSWLGHETVLVGNQQRAVAQLPPAARGRQPDRGGGVRDRGVVHAQVQADADEHRGNLAPIIE